MVDNDFRPVAEMIDLVETLGQCRSALRAFCILRIDLPPRMMNLETLGNLSLTQKELSNPDCARNDNPLMVIPH